jgi:selenocysteine lyase/cysteine desulfurase
VNVLGLGAAVRQCLELGLPAITERAVALGARLREQLDALPAVSTHDLGAQRCAIVTAGVAGVPAAQVAAALSAERINVTTTIAAHTQFDTEDRAVHPLVRLSPHYYNTEAELDRAVEVVARVAAG